jgi:hypothetical protein
MKRLGLPLALLVAGCSGGGTTVTVTTASTAPPPAKLGGPTGNLISVEDFRAYLKRIDEPWERDPAAVVGLLVGVGENDAARRSFEATVREDGFTEATLTLDGLFDDSVRTVRYRLALQRHDDGTWDVLSGFRMQRCREGRGHQQFSGEPCV